MEVKKRDGRKRRFIVSRSHFRLNVFELTFHVQKRESVATGETDVVDDEVTLFHLVARARQVDQVFCLVVASGIICLER